MDIFHGFLLQLLHGALITIKVSVCALILGLLLGLLGATGETSQHKWLRLLTLTITSLLRGLPELLIIFMIYFGGTLLLTNLFHRYIEVSAFVAGVIALAGIFAAYAAQTFRGAFAAIPKGQLEAAKALALSRHYTFFHILLPQAWRHALPGIGNLWLVLLKDSALVSLIGLADLMNKAQLAASTTKQPFTFYLTAALIYLIFNALSQGLLHYLNNRANKHLPALNL